MQRVIGGHVEVLVGGGVERETAAGDGQQMRRGVTAVMAVVGGGRAIVLMIAGRGRQGGMIGRTIARIHIRSPAEIGEQREDDQQSGDEGTSHGEAYCRKRMGAASHAI